MDKGVRIVFALSAVCIPQHIGVNSSFALMFSSLSGDLPTQWFVQKTEGELITLLHLIEKSSPLVF